MANDPQVPRSDFDALVGVEWLDEDWGHARARTQMGDQLRQPIGLLHGGVISTLVESVCSRATYREVVGQQMAAMGQSIGVSFIRPITEGTAEVRARARHRGRSTWIWEAEVTDSEGRLC